MKYIFVSSGMTTPKKGAAKIFKKSRYLNYGLLSLANSDYVHDGSVYHGGFDDPIVTIERILYKIGPEQEVTVLLSCPSYLSLDWALKFVFLLKKRFFNSTIILGGRWVVNGNAKFLMSKLTGVDHFVEGQGEPNIESIVYKITGRKLLRSKSAKNVFNQYGLSYLDYNKLFDVNSYVPSFEVSRGCGRGCSFCVESKASLTKMKPAEVLCKEVHDYQLVTKYSLSRCYFESSIFLPRQDWISELITERNRNGQSNIMWRTEARVDSFKPDTLELLAQAGLRVLDLGLESASLIQLKRMKKTKDPKAYLQRCESLLHCAKSLGIMTKVNVLLFPGETRDTISETTEWLQKHSSYITGVSVSPAYFYGFSLINNPTWDYYKSLGVSIARAEGMGGVVVMNLSNEVCAEAADDASKAISREFMSASAYYSLKSFSYFEPSYSYDAFKEDVIENPNDLTFSIPPEWVCL